MTTFQWKELQELREKGKRDFYRNGRLRIDETPLTRDTPPRRQDQDGESRQSSSTNTSHRHQEITFGQTPGSRGSPRHSAPEQPRPHREVAITAVSTGCSLSSSSRPTLSCRENEVNVRNTITKNVSTAKSLPAIA
ncbi:hypothetical protein ElyMa_001133100 [Elysia marginata]|uniref:Uncharacterized protein n=1 Tax=Elysia marginata TaxID=1093978 RepID=A0AAV4HX88_9GAST|nr:hypothetical protein ElyMa_001133100 [Elysia marginata]